MMEFTPAAMSRSNNNNNYYLQADSREEPLRAPSPSPSYRSKFSTPDLEGGSTSDLPLARGIGGDPQEIEYGGPHDATTPFISRPPPSGDRDHGQKGRFPFHPPHHYWKNKRKTPSSQKQKTHFVTQKTEQIYQIPSIASRLPGIIRAVLQIVVLILSPTIIGLLGHSLYLYHKTRDDDDVQLTGVTQGEGEEENERAWPESISLLPVNFLMAVAVISIVTSLIGIVQFIRYKSWAPVTVWDYINIACSTLVIVLGIVSTVVFHEDAGDGDHNLLSWSCSRKDDPSDKILNYKEICTEQNAAYDIAITLTVLESIILIAIAVTIIRSRRR